MLAFTEEEKREVHKLYDNGVANGVPVEILSRETVLAREPNLSDGVLCALWAPTGAIISPWESVSYTHLDVYKRQREGTPGRTFCARRARRSLRAWTGRSLPRGAARVRAIM